MTRSPLKVRYRVSCRQYSFALVIYRFLAIVRQGGGKKCVGRSREVFFFFFAQDRVVTVVLARIDLRESSI